MLAVRSAWAFCRGVFEEVSSMAQSTIVGQENSRVKSSTSATEPQAASSEPAGAAATKRAKKSRGLTFERRYTTASGDALGDMTWERRTSVITNPDGSVVFKMEGAEIPAGWSQLATDIVVSKYFRKAGIHGDKDVGETSVRQVVHRIAHTIREAGEQARRLLRHARRTPTPSRPSSSFLLVNQYGAFNSPVWFNCGLFHELRHRGLGRQLGLEPKPTDKCDETANAYERPQCSACFIQSVDDDLMGIYDLVKNEARLFKYGSGTGTNFSAHPRQAGEALGRRHLAAA